MEAAQNLFREGKLAEAGQRLERNHPQYLGAKAEVDGQLAAEAEIMCTMRDK